jgi:hypothetical protein
MYLRVHLDPAMSGRPPPAQETAYGATRSRPQRISAALQRVALLLKHKLDAKEELAVHRDRAKEWGFANVVRVDVSRRQKFASG